MRDIGGKGRRSRSSARAIGAALTALISLASLTSSPGSDAGVTEPGPGPALITCETRDQVIPGRKPTVDRSLREISVAIGPALFMAPGLWSAQPEVASISSGTRSKSVKAPLFVHSGPAVEIRLSAPSARKADFLIAQERGPAAQADDIVLRPCPPAAEVAGRRVGQWTPFLGGYKLAASRARCLQIEVTVPGLASDKRGRLPLLRHGCRQKP